MAHIHFSGAVSSDPYGEQGAVAASRDAAPARVTNFVNWAGAIVSLGLVIGMGNWAWQLLIRDVTEVPVIRAMEGPMRMAPVDPGGSIAENQGLAVNRLAEGEEAAAVPDRLVLAPPPIDLAAVAPVEQAFANASNPQAAAAPLADDAADSTTALIDRLLLEAQPLDPSDDAEPAATEAAPGDAIPTAIPGVRRSPRPLVRPASLTISAPAPGAVTGSALDAVTEDDAGFEIASADLEDGTRLVQLGAFDTADLARAEWQRLSGVFPDFFTGRARVIEQASSGGQTFYRLRAHGFSDLSASRRFCAALVAQGAACIPVTVR